MPVPTLSHVCKEQPEHSVDWLVVNDDPVPGSLWNEEVLHTARTLLSRHGRILLASRSTTITRLLKAFGRALRQLASRKMHGYRADLLALKH